MLNEADGGRFPNRAATLGQALGKYLEVTDLELSTKEAHQGHIPRTIGPVLGEVKVRKARRGLARFPLAPGRYRPGARGSGGQLVVVMYR